MDQICTQGNLDSEVCDSYSSFLKPSPYRPPMTTFFTPNVRLFHCYLQTMSSKHFLVKCCEEYFLLVTKQKLKDIWVPKWTILNYVSFLYQGPIHDISWLLIRLSPVFVVDVQSRIKVFWYVFTWNTDSFTWFRNLTPITNLIPIKGDRNLYFSE